jgi:S-adenosylmethionine hydrolase
MSIRVYAQTILLLFLVACTGSQAAFVVIQTDFGVKDGAVSAVKGVMYSVDENLHIADLTHEIPMFNIWEAAYRLVQTVPYWPKGTVFVSVVDPGVGTNRKSIVALSKNGYYFVTPDNGTLTLIDDVFGIQSIREIDQQKHRLKNSNESATFDGRDLYGHTAAKLASGKINYTDVGPTLQSAIHKIVYTPAKIENNKLVGTIVVLDPQFGNV